MTAPPALQASDLPGVIETTRLVLRPWQADDLDVLHEALCESVEHLKPWIPWATPEAPTLAQAEARLATWLDEYINGDTFLYAIFDRSDATLVGGIGYFPRIGPGGLEIGYWIRLSRAGSGFATESTRALTDVGLRLPGVDRLEIHIDPENGTSRRVPEKLGYSLLGIVDDAKADGTPRKTVVFVLERR